MPRDQKHWWTRWAMRERRFDKNLGGICFMMMLLEVAVGKNNYWCGDLVCARLNCGSLEV
jgi:hypothetical protein